MTYDDGVVLICDLKNVAIPPAMPVQRLAAKSQHFYAERTVGYNRQYAAMGVNEYVDMLIRVWMDRSIHVGQYAVLEDGRQYRIANIAQIVDEDGLRATEITLRRMDDLYDVENANQFGSIWENACGNHQ